MKFYVSKGWHQVGILVKIVIASILLFGVYLQIYLIYQGYLAGGSLKTALIGIKDISLILFFVVFFAVALFSLIGIWLPRFMLSHVKISERYINSTILYRTCCTVDIERTLFYAESRYNIGRGTNEDFLFVSNEPFKLVKGKRIITPLDIYDPQKQIAMPDNEYTREILVNAVYLGRTDFA